MTSARVALPGDSSTSGTRKAGLSQCALMNRRDRRLNPPCRRRGMVDVVEAMIVSGRAMRDVSASPARFVPALRQALRKYGRPIRNRPASPSGTHGDARPSAARCSGFMRPIRRGSPERIGDLLRASAAKAAKPRRVPRLEVDHVDFVSGKSEYDRQVPAPCVPRRASRPACQNPLSRRRAGWLCSFHRDRALPACVPSS